TARGPASTGSSPGSCRRRSRPSLPRWAARWPGSPASGPRRLLGLQRGAERVDGLEHLAGGPAGGAGAARLLVARQGQAAGQLGGPGQASLQAGLRLVAQGAELVQVGQALQQGLALGG